MTAAMSMTDAQFHINIALTYLGGTTPATPFAPEALDAQDALARFPEDPRHSRRRPRPVEPSASRADAPTYTP